MRVTAFGHLALIFSRASGEPSVGLAYPASDYARRRAQPALRRPSRPTLCAGRRARGGDWGAIGAYIYLPTSGLVVPIELSRRDDTQRRVDLSRCLEGSPKRGGVEVILTTHRARLVCCGLLVATTCFRAAAARGCCRGLASCAYRVLYLSLRGMSAVSEAAGRTRRPAAERQARLAAGQSPRGRLWATELQRHRISGLSTTPRPGTALAPSWAIRPPTLTTSFAGAIATSVPEVALASSGIASRTDGSPSRTHRAI